MNALNMIMRRWLLLPFAILVVFAWQLALWTVDRKPPFEILGVISSVVSPGNVARLEAQVRRDTHRPCSAEFTRVLFDGRGYRFDLEGAQTLNAAAINQLQVLQPNKIALAIHVPPAAAPGQAHLVTSINYVCNPTHLVKPIHVLAVIPFTIKE